MPMKRILTAVGLALLAGCVDSARPNAGISGPTGRASDAGIIHTIKVRDVWKENLKPLTRDVVVRKLALGKTARFEDPPRFDGYYDSDHNVTRVAAYGDVTTYTDYGTVIKNGYYVVWENQGQVKTDFPQTPWQLVDVEIMDQPY
jgi:hypothetical protein